MVGAFPEPRLVVVAVDGAVGASAPVPFAVFGVEDVVADVLRRVRGGVPVGHRNAARG